MANLTIIQSKIYEIRGQKVMLDFDLADLYQVQTKILNQAVKSNADRFPKDFMFRLNKKEWDFSKVTNCDLRKRKRQIPQISATCFY